MLQHPERYLYIPYVKGGGLDSKLHDLEHLINIALSMKRVPILEKNETSRRHAHDGSEEYCSIHWERYINLSETIILKMDAGGVVKKISDTLQYIHEKDFDFNLYTEDQIRYIDETQIHDKENNQYPIICVLNKKDYSSLKRPANFPPKPILKTRASSKIYDSSFFIQLPPSEKVNILTDIVLNYFGTTRESMELLINMLYGFFPRPKRSYQRVYEKLGCYMCMHVRYGHNKKHAAELIEQSSDLKEMLEKTVKEAYRWKHNDMPLYIMSNIMNPPDYFDFLKSQYDVYRYTDIKGLKEKLTVDNVIDHNLLFSVEKNIMRCTPFKIFSQKADPFIFQGRWSNTYSGISKKEQRQIDHRQKVDKKPEANLSQALRRLRIR